MNKLLELEIEKLKAKSERRGRPVVKEHIEIEDLSGEEVDNSRILDGLDEQPSLLRLNLKGKKKEANSPQEQTIDELRAKRDRMKLEKKRLFRSFRAPSREGISVDGRRRKAKKERSEKPKEKFRGFSRFHKQRDRNKSEKVIIKDMFQNEEPQINRTKKAELDDLINLVKRKKSKKPKKSFRNNFVENKKKKQRRKEANEEIKKEEPYVPPKINKLDIQKSPEGSKLFPLNEPQSPSPTKEFDEDYILSLMRKQNTPPPAENVSPHLSGFTDLESINVKLDYSKSNANSRLSSLQQNKTVIESRIIRSTVIQEKTKETRNRQCHPRGQ